MAKKVHRSHAQVFACLANGELVITMFPGNGHVDGGVKWHVPVEAVPIASRLPNALLWVTWERDVVIKIEPRDADDLTPMS